MDATHQIRLVDAHCHLESEEFADRLGEIIAGARTAGIVKLITAAIVPEQWEQSAAIARAHPEVAFALGVHPWYALEAHLAALPALANARAHGACAIGEIGLDGKIATPSMDFQQRIFEEQLRIAKELDLPVALHCRGAFNELLESLKRVGAPAPGGIVHAFSGSAEVAEACMAHGLCFSMGGALSYRKSNKRDRTLRRIWPDHLLLETDSPDIPPVQAAGQTNVPANIVYNLAGAAAYLALPEAKIAAQTTRNANRIFSLGLEAPGA